MHMKINNTITHRFKVIGTRFLYKGSLNEFFTSCAIKDELLWDWHYMDVLVLERCPSYQEST